MTVKVTKSTCEVYRLKSNKPYWWAIITLDEETGTFSVHSDYGDYAYSWTSRGKGISLKEFLIRLEKDDNYLMEKLSNGKREFDLDKTIEAIEKDFQDALIDSPWHPDAIQGVKEEIVTLKNCCNEHEFSNRLFDSDCLYEYLYGLEPYGIPICKEFPVQLKMFTQNVFPEFVKILKEEQLVEDKE